jgi:hypothetical protein
MTLPELDVARVQRWCAARVPEPARHQVRVECQVAPRHLTIIERRAPWREDFGPEWTTFPIARLRYTAADKLWTPVLARSQSSLPPLRPAGAFAPGRRPAHRARPRPHLHLLGLTTTGCMGCHKVQRSRPPPPRHRPPDAGTQPARERLLARRGWPGTARPASAAPTPST